jgi:hypothetical protein
MGRAAAFGVICAFAVIATIAKAQTPSPTPAPAPFPGTQSYDWPPEPHAWRATVPPSSSSSSSSNPNLLASENLFDLSSGQALVAAQGRSIAAIDAVTGATLWNVSIACKSLSRWSPCDVDNIVKVDNDRFYWSAGFSCGVSKSATGSPQWALLDSGSMTQAKGVVPIETRVNLFDRLWIGNSSASGYQSVIVRSATTGEVLWHNTAFSPVTASLTCTGINECAFLDSGYSFAMARVTVAAPDPKDIDVLWTAGTGSFSKLSAAAFDQKLPVMFAATSSSVMAISMTNGSVLWTESGFDGVSAAYMTRDISFGGEPLLLVAGQNHFYFLAIASGAQRAKTVGKVWMPSSQWGGGLMEITSISSVVEPGSAAKKGFVAMQGRYNTYALRFDESLPNRAELVFVASAQSLCDIVYVPAIDSLSTCLTRTVTFINATSGNVSMVVEGSTGNQQQAVKPLVPATGNVVVTVLGGSIVATKLDPTNIQVDTTEGRIVGSTTSASGRTIYLSTYSGVTAIDAKTRKVLFRTQDKTTAFRATTPVVLPPSGSDLYVISYGTVYNFNALSGSLIWMRKLSSSSFGSVNPFVIFRSTRGNYVLINAGKALTCLEPQNGGIQYSVTKTTTGATLSTLLGRPTIIGSSVFCLDYYGKLHKVDVSTGTYAGSTSIGYTVGPGTLEAPGDGNMYVCAGTYGRFVQISPSFGKKTVKFACVTGAAVTVSRGSLYTLGGPVDQNGYGIGRNALVRVSFAADGSVFQSPTASYDSNSFFLTAAGVAVTAAGNYVSAVNVFDVALRWTVRIENVYASRSIRIDGNVVYYSSRGALYGFDLFSGKLLLQVPLSDDQSSGSFVADVTVLPLKTAVTIAGGSSVVRYELAVATVATPSGWNPNAPVSTIPPTNAPTPQPDRWTPQPNRWTPTPRRNTPSPNSNGPYPWDTKAPPTTSASGAAAAGASAKSGTSWWVYMIIFGVGSSVVWVAFSSYQKARKRRMLAQSRGQSNMLEVGDNDRFGLNDGGLGQGGYVQPVAVSMPRGNAIRNTVPLSGTTQNALRSHQELWGNTGSAAAGCITEDDWGDDLLTRNTPAQIIRPGLYGPNPWKKRSGLI